MPMGQAQTYLYVGPVLKFQYTWASMFILFKEIFALFVFVTLCANLHFTKGFAIVQVLIETCLRISHQDTETGRIQQKNVFLLSRIALSHS